MEKLKVRSRAPLRLGLAGGGTDLSPYADEHGGAILNATINSFVYTTIEALDGNEIILESLDLNLRETYPLRSRLDPAGELILHKGVYNRIARDFNGGEPLAVRITTQSQAPAGSGLGSSSTVVVSILGAFQELLGLPLGEYELAHLAWDIERRELGLAGGRQDQYAAAFGGVNFMEFFSGERVIVNPLRVRREILNELEYNLILYYSGRSRTGDRIIREQVENVRSQNERSVSAMHELKAQSYEMKEALLKGRLEEIGRILARSWKAKKNMASGISTDSIEAAYLAAISAGAVGGKVTGAGGGGFMMIYTDGDRRLRIEEVLASFGGEVRHFQFVKTGLEAWKVAAS